MLGGMETARLRLRPLAPADAPAFAAMNADPLVMRHFPAPLTRAESDAVLHRLVARRAEHGFGPDALERDGAFIGMLGLQPVPFEAPFTPAVEILWRLAARHHRQGYAEEAARAVLQHGFTTLRLPEIVAMTVEANEPSWRLMQKLGFRRAADFDNPRLPEGHPLRRHMLWRLPSPASIAPLRDARDLRDFAALLDAYVASLGVDLAYQGWPAERAALPGPYAPPHGAALLARDAAGTPLGCVALRPLGEGIAEMKRLYLTPAARNRGLGRALAEAAIAAARAAGHRELRLDTLGEMVEAQRLYRALGFTECEPCGTAIEGTLFFRKELGAVAAPRPPPSLGA